jgi:hypothetical protein
MSDLKEYRNVANHAASLEGGRMVDEGGFTGPIDPALPAHQQLIADGQLIPVPDGTFNEEYGVKPPDPQTQLTGDALKERAAELDIQGRSSMNADELRAAIEEAERDSDEEGDSA